MLKARTLVGLDVHAAKIVAAVLDEPTGEVSFHRLPGEISETVALCKALPGPVSAAYEAGPTGYGLARALDQAEVGCIVAAPGKIPRGATERIKTDSRDAEHLVRLLLAGKLAAVRVPGTDEEALRDLVRAREDIRGELMAARHRLSKLLLRHGLRYEGTSWTGAHSEWLKGIELSHEPAQLALCDYRGAVEALTVRRTGLERAIEAAIGGSPWEREIGRLRCLRGIDTLSAAGLCAEIGDFARFAKAGQLMSYLGLVPSEHSSGERRRLGQITKSGSRHGRRLLVEAAWHYRHRPARGVGVRRRQAGQPAAAIAVSWSAQQRGHRVWERMRARRKRPTVIAVAVARELAGFCWAITRIED